MSSELTNLLLLAIDKYERGTEDYDAFSVAAEQEVLADSGDYRRMREVRKATGRELKSKIFESTGKVDAEFSRLMATKPRVTRSLSVEEVRRTLEEARNAKATPDNDQERAGDENQVQLPLVPSADFELFFARELASRLDLIVSRVERLEERPYSDILSRDLRSLLWQAHRCYLYGFEEAAAIMCGAVLEQLLKKTLHLDWKLEQLLDEAKERGVLTHEQWVMGDDIRERRNEAVHNPQKFHEQPEHLKATILSNTRDVVGILLSGNTDLKESS